jgi:hypothetical protein
MVSFSSAKEIKETVTDLAVSIEKVLRNPQTYDKISQCVLLNLQNNHSVHFLGKYLYKGQTPAWTKLVSFFQNSNNVIATTFHDTSTEAVANFCNAYLGQVKQVMLLWMAIQKVSGLINPSKGNEENEVKSKALQFSEALSKVSIVSLLSNTALLAAKDIFPKMQAASSISPVFTTIASATWLGSDLLKIADAKTDTETKRAWTNVAFTVTQIGLSTILMFNPPAGGLIIAVSFTQASVSLARDFYSFHLKCYDEENTFELVEEPKINEINTIKTDTL